MSYYEPGQMAGPTSGPLTGIGMQTAGMRAYRRVPGQPHRYYDLYTREEISQYQYRRYLKGLTPYQRSLQDEFIRQSQVRYRQTRQQAIRDYQAAQRLQGQQFSRAAINRNAEFNANFRRLLQLSKAENDLRIRMEAALRQGDMITATQYQQMLLDLTAPDGEMAETLVALGRRPADADWQVGVSAQQEGWSQYISTVPGMTWAQFSSNVRV